MVRCKSSIYESVAFLKTLITIEMASQKHTALD